MTPRSVLSRLIFAANAIILHPDKALVLHVQRDLAEIGDDLAEAGLHAVDEVAGLHRVLTDIANKPLATGGEIARLVHEAEHYRAQARDHLHYIISKAGASNAGSEENPT